MTRFRLAVVPLLAVLLAASISCQKTVLWTDQEKPIADSIQKLRSLPDAQRAAVTKDLALQIRKLSDGKHKLILAQALASRATEGDFGHDTLQEVTTTLEQAANEQSASASAVEPTAPYKELAELARYEHMKVSLDDPQYALAMAELEQIDHDRAQADFTLTDSQGKSWTLKQLRGKVVLVNFWATWCPPCRKEMPDIDALYRRFSAQGLVVLALTDEDESTVKAFLAQHPVSYPLLIDTGSKVHKLFHIEGIPKTFIYDREGSLAAQSIDMRTRQQFLHMLAEAGLK